MRRNARRRYRTVETTILFADVKGFTALTNHHPRLFLEKILPLISTAIRTHGVHEPNSWGDGIVAFYDSAAVAVRAALNLRDSFRRFEWDAIGLPRLQIRIALHSGEVFQGWDPVRRRYGRIGTEINRAARIEPIVAPNHVYVTSEFRQRCNTSGVAFVELGSVALAKAWGEDILYVALWEGETVDVSRLLVAKPDERRDALDPDIVLGRFRSSQFVRRLSVAAEAKRALAAYAVDQGIWTAADVVFLQSGTIPVYLFCELLRRGTVGHMPKRIITNNAILPVIASLVAGDGDVSQAAYPDDERMMVSRRASTTQVPPLHLLSGELIDRAAATIPRGFVGPPAGLVSAWENLRRTLRTEGVTHLMLMMTGIRATKGPAIVGLGMRRFAHALLLYAAENPGVRITMFIEADKLLKVFGQSVDSVKLRVRRRSRSVWHELCRSGRVNLLIAMGKDNSPNDEGFVRRQLDAFEKRGIHAVCIPFAAPALDG